MKKFLISLAALSVAAPMMAHADPGKGKGHGRHGPPAVMRGPAGTPPGLAKKPYGLPPGQARKAWATGERLPTPYYTQQRYFVTDPSRYSLPPAPYGSRWVRVGDSYYLAQTQTGLITQIISALVR